MLIPFLLTVSVILASYHWMATQRGRIRRDQLPKDLKSWRNGIPGHKDPFNAIWSQLHDFFDRHGLRLWISPQQSSTLRAPTEECPSPGFVYVTHSDPRSRQRVMYLAIRNALSFVARRRDGLDVVIRVITAGGQGDNHRKILKRIASGQEALFQDNHTLPLLCELVYQDITFGVFPRVSVCMERSICSWPKNTVDDILDMIMQALEGINFIHERLIAHRDLFSDNFLLEWHPESLHSRKQTRPRVYIIDFEIAVEFPSDSNPATRLVSGFPFGQNVKTYSRPRAPELGRNSSYCPFKLDIWQFGTAFKCWRSTIPEIDTIIESMRSSDAHSRPTAKQSLESLDGHLRSLPLCALQIAPVCTNPLI